MGIDYEAALRMFIESPEYLVTLMAELRSMGVRIEPDKVVAVRVERLGVNGVRVSAYLLGGHVVEYVVSRDSRGNVTRRVSVSPPEC